MDDQLTVLLDTPWLAAVLGAMLGLVIGSYLAKREGIKVWREWQRALTELRPPEQGVIDGVLVLVGALVVWMNTASKEKYEKLLPVAGDMARP